MNKEILQKEIQQVKEKLGDDKVSIWELFRFLEGEAPGRYTVKEVKEAGQKLILAEKV